MIKKVCIHTFLTAHSFITNYDLKKAFPSFSRFCYRKKLRIIVLDLNVFFLINMYIYILAVIFLEILLTVFRPNSASIFCL